MDTNIINYYQPTAPTTVLRNTDAKESVIVESTIVTDSSRRIMYEVISNDLMASRYSADFGGNAYMLNKLQGSNGHKASYKVKTIVNGMVDVACVTTEFTNRGTPREIVTLKVTSFVDGSVGSLEILKSDLFDDPKTVVKKLQENGVLCVNMSAQNKLIYHLQMLCMRCQDIRTKHEGFYLEEDKLMNDKAQLIYEKAAEPQDVIALLELNSNGDIPWFKWLLLGLLCLRMLVNFIDLSTLAVLAFRVLNVRGFADWLSKRLGCHAVVLDKRFDADTLSDFNVVDTSECSVYMMKTILPKLPRINKDKKIAVVIRDAQALAESMDFSEYIMIPCDSLPSMSEDDVDRFLAWFSSRLLKHPELLEKIILQARECACNVLETQVAELISLVAAVMCAILIELHCENAVAVLKTFVYLLEEHLNTESSTEYTDVLVRWIEMQDLKDISDFSTAERHNSCVLLYDKYVCLTASALAEAAEAHSISASQLASNLYSDGLLETNDKLQKMIRVKDGTTRLYTLPLDKLYRFGEIRPSVKATDDPYVSFEIGKSGDKEVYFSLFGEDNSQNPHAYICGPSASGKTFFLNSLASNAYEQGVQVVSVGLYGSALEIDDSDIFDIDAKDFGVPDSLVMSEFAETALHHGNWTVSEEECLAMMKDGFDMNGTAENLISEISGCSNDAFKDTLTHKLNALVMQGIFNSDPDWDDIFCGTPVTIIASDGDKITLEAIFRSLFDWKQRSDRSPMLLIVDECQSCDLSQSGTISKLIMRQGRKFGIMCFLASQYLSAEDARNISKTLAQCETNIAFAPSDNIEVLKRFGISANDRDTRASLNELPQYSCVARGKLSCNGAEVNYPVVLRA